MTPAAIKAISALSGVSCGMHTKNKRFIADMVSLAQMSPETDLSDRQSAYIIQLLHYYRKQLPADIISSVMFRREVPCWIESSCGVRNHFFYYSERVHCAVTEGGDVSFDLAEESRCYMAMEVQRKIICHHNFCVGLSAYVMKFPLILAEGQALRIYFRGVEIPDLLIKGGADNRWYMHKPGLTLTYFETPL